MASRIKQTRDLSVISEFEHSHNLRPLCRDTSRLHCAFGQRASMLSFPSSQNSSLHVGTLFKFVFVFHMLLAVAKAEPECPQDRSSLENVGTGNVGCEAAR